VLLLVYNQWRNVVEWYPTAKVAIPVACGVLSTQKSMAKIEYLMENSKNTVDLEASSATVT